MPDNSIDVASMNGSGERHVPVLLHEVVELLNVRAGLTYVDATAGAGGHLRAIIEKIQHSSGTRPPATAGEGAASPVIGIDRDAKSLSRLEAELDGRARLVHGNYSQIKSIVEEQGHRTIDGGILADLGVSSMQIDDAERGFSFLKEGPLDMRMDRSQSTTAEDLVNTLPEERLAEIIYKYGEDRLSRRIAAAIVRARPLRTTLQLSEVVARCIGYTRGKKRGGKGGTARNLDSSHPATRTFQALRIAVNEELTSLEKFLQDSVQVLAPGARLVIITFHSLEDRLVKQILRHHATECVCPPKLPVCTCHHTPDLLIITRKPVVASEKEVLANIRSRSAKLRAGEKL